jgi:putative ABC transport system permease protein
MLAVIVSVAIVIGISVMEQRKEIDTLRAIGAQRWRIFSFVVIESLVLSISGALLAFPFKKFTELAILQFGRVSLLQDELGIWFGSILVAALVGVLAALLPGWQAMRVDPLEAMRYE